MWPTLSLFPSNYSYHKHGMSLTSFLVSLSINGVSGRFLFLIILMEEGEGEPGLICCGSLNFYYGTIMGFGHRPRQPIWASQGFWQSDDDDDDDGG